MQAFQVCIRFKNMSDEEWDQIMEVHLKGAFACTKAAWPIFRKQKFGRVINTASAAGLYGLVHKYSRIIHRLTSGNTRQFRTGKLQCGKDGPYWFHEDLGS